MLVGLVMKNTTKPAAWYKKQSARTSAQHGLASLRSATPLSILAAEENHFKTMASSFDGFPQALVFPSSPSVQSLLWRVGATAMLGSQINISPPREPLSVFRLTGLI